MEQALTALSICVIDWVVASRAMAYTTQLVLDDVSPPAFNAKGPKWLPFYERQWGKHDFFHIMGWPRYLALGWFAWIGFGWDEIWERVEFGRDLPYDEVGTTALMIALGWTIATAWFDAFGWFVLKILHGKLAAWGWRPGWMR